MSGFGNNMFFLHFMKTLASADEQLPVVESLSANLPDWYEIQSQCYRRVYSSLVVLLTLLFIFERWVLHGMWNDDQKLICKYHPRDWLIGIAAFYFAYEHSYNYMSTQLLKIKALSLEFSMRVACILSSKCPNAKLSRHHSCWTWEEKIFVFINATFIYKKQ